MFIPNISNTYHPYHRKNIIFCLWIGTEKKIESLEVLSLPPCMNFYLTLPTDVSSHQLYIFSNFIS
jgi:hypothetical protein